MTHHDPLTRERQAHVEIGVTAISLRLARALCGLFLFTVVAVPTAELLRPDGLGAWRALLGGGRRAVEIAAEGSLVAGNRELLAAMHAFEDRLDEESAVASLALPSAQWVQTALLGAGNEQVLVGRDGWLFFLPAVRYLAGPGFLEPAALRVRTAAADAWRPAPQPDPTLALRALRRDLAARGIALVVLPTPVKASLLPDRLKPAATAPEVPLQNPSWGRFLDALAADGIAVIDPAPALLAAQRADGQPSFLTADTHWTPAAVERTAGILASWIESQGLLAAGEPAAFRARPAERIAGVGDLARLLELPAGSTLFPPQTVTVRPVGTAGGGPWSPDPAAELLLVGDSYANVFSQPDLGWGEGAGLAEQLSLALGRAIDRLAVNAGGAHASRGRLYELLAHDDPRIAAKRLVVYQFSVRELTAGDWILFDAGTAARRPAERLDGGASTPPEPPGALEPAARVPPTTAGAAIEPGAGPAPIPPATLGDGYAVWESNRSGDWRIWYRRLDGTGLRQLTPDEPGLQHCCPHLSPDGRRLVYLARAGGRDAYPEREIAGPLRLVALDQDSGRVEGARTLVESARTYGWGDRAAVWRGDSELIYVAGDGRTELLDLATGSRRELTTEPRAELGWLIDPTLRWATNAAPSFSRYDREARRVIERGELGGCEPYFDADGRWGVFMPAGGGPIERIDPETREVATLVRKFDRRMPGDQGYLYFPTVSRDGRVLAFGASAGEHDHFRADYDIYAALVDPATLELQGDPVRLTDDPATDRYPDVWLRPLPLGRHAGEAPLAVEFPGDPGATAADWDYGDGARETTAAGRHTYERPGGYEVTARRGDQVRRGRVTVQPPAPPRVQEVTPRAASRELEVTFDEPVRLTGRFAAALASGIAVAGHRLDGGGRRLVLELSAPLAGADRLRLSGVTDRAQRPNPMPAAELPVEPPSWPSDRAALRFLWQTADRPNEVFDPELRADVADPLTAHGRARLDRYHRMVLGGGWFTATAAAGDRLRAAVGRGNEVTLEATVVAASARTDGLAPIVTLSGGPGARDLTLGQDGGDLVVRVRTGPTGPNGDRPQVRLFPATPGRPQHVVITYSPGRLNAYLDGRPAVASDAVQGGLNRWRGFPLAFGAEPGGAGDWAGTLEGVALYSRVLAPAEVRENFVRYRAIRAGRAAGADAGGGERLVVRATLLATSEIPTLRQISPYRRALAVHAWRVDEVLAGAGPAAGDRLRVAHWVLLDGERTPAASLRPGAVARLRLEPFAANPQLEAHYLADTLAGPGDGPLYYAVDD